MYKSVIGVTPANNYNLILTFEDGEKRLFDMSPYLEKGVFKELRDVDKFNSVTIHFDTIAWDNEADIDPEVLYQNSIKL